MGARPGQGARRLLPRGAPSGPGRGGCRLHVDALPGQVALGGPDVLLGCGHDPPAAVAQRGDDLLGAGRGGDGDALGDRRPGGCQAGQGGATLGLDGHQGGEGVDPPGPAQVGETPVQAEDHAAVAGGDDHRGGGPPAQLLPQLIGAGLGALGEQRLVGVAGVDRTARLDAAAGGGGGGRPVTVHQPDLGARTGDGCQLARRRAGGDVHLGGDPGPGGVGGEGGAGVAARIGNHRSHPRRGHGGHQHGGTAVLEGKGRVLEVELPPQVPPSGHQRGHALPE